MMSNYPPTPSYEGAPNYSQQWPPTHPQDQSSSVPPMFPPNFPFPHQISENVRQQFEADMNAFHANSRIPGLGLGGPGTIPPPPFPFMPPFGTNPSQFPPPPFPMQMPPLRYPPMPLPTDPNQTQQNGEAGNAVVNMFASRDNVMSSSRQDGDREEGELTDKEGGSSTKSKSDVRPGRGTSRQARPHDRVRGAPASRGSHRQNLSMMDREETNKNPRANAWRSTTSLSKAFDGANSDIEEGEASSVSSSSSRESGSPYNPSIPLTEHSLAPQHRDTETPTYDASKASLEGRPLENGTLSSTKETQEPNVKSPVQLRVQAQGALLSLAPHNIRYTELVKEGIDPTILRQLYEEVGIKVSTPQLDTAAPANTSLTATSKVPSKQKEVTQAQGKEKQTIQPPSVVETNTAPPCSSQSETSKPMERKEVIARMLAAKAAAKTSTAPASPQSDQPKVTAMDGPCEPSDAVQSETPSDTPSKEKEVRTREKNKAQTELARQRIEQLKKKGFMRNQPKPQPDAISNESQPDNGIGQASTSSSESLAVQHPLPERPPEPASSVPARIPGLFMTDSESSLPRDSMVAPSQNHVTGPTPHPQASLRKRPRASDFDEPVPIPRRPLSQPDVNAPENRLIIDISDDEFYSDDENDNMDIDARGGPTPQDAWSTGLNSMNNGFSKPSTPQNSKNPEQDGDLRKKEMAIQEMRRQIAELEQRKKTRLNASGTQSPRALNSSGSSVADNPVVADAQPTVQAEPEIESTMPISEAAPTSLVVPPSVESQPTGFSPHALASMDASLLERLRSKILRKKEIESGLPALDAELHRSHARLGLFKQEESQILLDIARGEEGRRQLIEELERLSREINGLSLEELDAAQRRLEVKEAPVSPEQDSTIPPVFLDSSPHASAAPSLARGEVESAQEAISAGQDPEEAAELPTDLSGNTDAGAIASANEPSVESPSDSTGSAMDESDDTTSSESSSDDDEDSVSSSEHPGVDEEDTDAMDLEEPTQLPANGSQEPDRQVESAQPEASREFSPDSEAYEPPEPEHPGSPESIESIYTPPLSLASPGPVEPTESTSQPLDQSQADEPLTEKVQELAADSRNNGQIGILDNERRSDEPGHKFSTYISPLKQFKAYRYHPAFADDVAGGYRSLTYSHNIDPMKHLCPFESSGGVCNDRSCEYQHFRDMTLSDDKILVQMGSLREGKTPEEKDQYLDGLKQIINDMRRDKVKEFNTVATEIAAYRRRFLQDPSRVLPL